MFNDIINKKFVVISSNKCSSDLYNSCNNTSFTIPGNFESISKQFYKNIEGLYFDNVKEVVLKECDSLRVKYDIESCLDAIIATQK